MSVEHCSQGIFSFAASDAPLNPINTERYNGKIARHHYYHHRRHQQQTLTGVLHSTGIVLDLNCHKRVSTKKPSWSSWVDVQWWVQEVLTRRGLRPLKSSSGGKGEQEVKEKRESDGDGDGDGDHIELSKEKLISKKDVEEKEETMFVGNSHYQEWSLQSDAVTRCTLVALLKACAKQKDLQRGSRLHAYIIQMGLFENNIFIGCALVSMYAKCGALAKAQQAFDKLSFQNTVSWSALMTGYAQYGHGEQALNCFDQMQLDGFSPDAVTYICILKACGSIGDTKKGQQIHTEIVKEGLLIKDVIVGTALVDMYVKCGLLAKAQEVFDNLPVQNLVSWNVLIAGYAQHGLGELALIRLQQMRLKGLYPNGVTFVCMLKACSSIGARYEGQELHAEIVKEGLLDKDILVGNALVDMYAKCGLLVKAQVVFDTLPVRDVVLWSALIAGYAQHGDGEQALNCFERMQLEGLSPNIVTFVCILKACGSIGAADKGQEIHAEILRGGLLEKHIVVGTALIDMYGKCGLLANAQEVFHALPVHNIVAWTALIAGFTLHGHGEQALIYFQQMQYEGLSPDAVTFACILKACGGMGALDKGQAIHTQLLKNGLVQNDTFVGTALVDMYAKCGCLSKAQEVFGNLRVRDIVSWNVLISGYALLGKAQNVFDSFDAMTREGVKPDLVTFTGVLNVCAHTGLVNKGQMYFESMSRGYGTSPTLEHYTIMVDLFSRAGLLNKALGLMKEMPFSVDIAVWHIVLGACRKWGNMKLGKMAFERAVHLHEMDAEAYICVSNIYSKGKKDTELRE